MFRATWPRDVLDRDRFLFLSSFVLLSLLSVVEQEKREKAGQNPQHRAEDSEPE